MSAAWLLTWLVNHGVRITVEGSNLKVDAPKGVVTPHVKRAIREHKQELIHILSQPMRNPDPPPDVTDLLTPENIEQFKREIKEVCIETAGGHLVWIVPERSRAADRLEITPEDLLRPGIVREVELLAKALRLFGGRMISMKAS